MALKLMAAAGSFPLGKKTPVAQPQIAVEMDALRPLRISAGRRPVLLFRLCHDLLFDLFAQLPFDDFRHVGDVPGSGRIGRGAAALAALAASSALLVASLAACCEI